MAKASFEKADMAILLMELWVEEQRKPEWGVGWAFFMREV